MVTKTKATQEKAQKARAQTRQLAEVGRELGKLRLAFADALGKVERHEAVIREQGAKLKKLYADPIYQVPVDLKRRVEDMEKKVDRTLTKMTSKASQEDVDELKGLVKVLQKQRDEVDATIGDHHDRLVLLEDQATSPAPHASPPKAKVEPRADPRQTTLDEGIARAKDKDANGSDVDDDEPVPDLGPDEPLDEDGDDESGEEDEDSDDAEGEAA